MPTRNSAATRRSPLRCVQAWFGAGLGPNTAGDDLAPRRVVTLAWPAVVEGLLQTAIGVVDTFMVSRVSEAALAGVGTALQIIFVMIVFMTAISVGASVLVAQAHGAGDQREARSFSKQALSLVTLLTIPLSVVGVALARPLVDIFGVEPDVAAIGADYWRVTAYGLLAMTGMFVTSAVLRGVGDTQTPMRATMIANVINAVLAYLLIFGQLGLPALGPVGSAWASVVGRGLGLLFMLWVLLRPAHPASVAGRGGWLPQRSTVKRILGIGFPAALEELSFALSFATLTAVIAILGTSALAAQRIAFNALSLAFLPAFGLSLATTSLVGQSVGARDPRGGSLAVRIAAQYAVVWMGAIGVLYLLLAEPVMRAFSDDPAVVAMGVDALRVLALSQPFWGLEFVFAGALRGTGNSRFPLLVNSVWTWSCVGLSAIVVRLLGGGLASVWLVFLVLGPFPMLAFRWRMRRDPHLGHGVVELDRLNPPSTVEPASATRDTVAGRH